MPVAAGVDIKTPPAAQVQKMDAAAYFGRLARLMKDNPPAPADAPMVEKLEGDRHRARPGLRPRQARPGTARGLQRAMDGFALLEKGVKKLKTDNGWIVMPKNMANYGTDYVTRAGIALVGLGAILPVDIQYPTAFDDGDDKPLDAANRYVLHFDKGQTPPTTSSGRSRCTTRRATTCPTRSTATPSADAAGSNNADGSLDIYIQPTSPGAEKESNWLPAPAGRFILVMRLYWPKDGTFSTARTRFRR